jgi:hypothetical protein
MTPVYGLPRPLEGEGLLTITDTRTLQTPHLDPLLLSNGRGERLSKG